MFLLSLLLSLDWFERVCESSENIQQVAAGFRSEIVSGFRRNRFFSGSSSAKSEPRQRDADAGGKMRFGVFAILISSTDMRGRQSAGKDRRW